MPGPTMRESSWAYARHVAVARNVTTHNPNRVSFTFSSCRGAAINVGASELAVVVLLLRLGRDGLDGVPVLDDLAVLEAEHIEASFGAEEFVLALREDQVPVAERPHYLVPRRLPGKLLECKCRHRAF